jgi:hypothetical protein
LSPRPIFQNTNDKSGARFVQCPFFLMMDMSAGLSQGARPCKNKATQTGFL